jgi:hypothetical protein
VAQHAQAFGHGLARFAQAGQPLQLHYGQAYPDAGQQDAGAGHDEERRPGPDAERDQAERQGDAEQDEHQAADEGGQPEPGHRDAHPARVALELGLGQVDLVPDQLGYVLGGQGDQVAE